MKKVLSLVLVLTLVLGSFSFAFAAPTDVVGTEYEEAVDRLEQLKVLEGYPDGTFKPENTITRAEFAAAVVRVKGLAAAAEAAKGATGFSDVPASNWASGYVSIATKAGLVKGMGDGTFAPNAPVTYEQAVTMIVRALGYEEAAEARGGYPYGHLIIANQEGLLDSVRGTQGLPAPRGLVAQLLDNALEIPLMIQVGYGTQTKWVKSGTEETDEIYLLTELGYKNSVDRVTKYDATRKLITVGTKVLEVKDGFNFEEVKGLRVIAWYDNYDNLVLLSKIDAPKFDAVEPTKTGLYLIGEEKAYALAKDKDGKVAVTLTLDGVSVSFDKFEADYAKVVLDKYGDIAWAEGFTFDGNVVVEKVDGNVIESYGYEELSLKGYTLVKDGKDLAVADLEENDIVFYNNATGIKFAVVYNNAIEGKVGKIYSSPASFELGEEKYEIGVAKYLDGKVLGNLDAATVNSIKTEQEEVTIFTNFYGELVLMVGTRTAAAPASVVVVIDSRQYSDTRSGDLMYTLDVLNAEGKIVKYDLTRQNVADLLKVKLADLNIADWFNRVGMTNTVTGGSGTDKVVQLSVNASGKVTAVTALSTTPIADNSSDWVTTTATYVDNIARLQGSAVVFRVDGETDHEDYSVTTWDKADEEFTRVEEGTAYYNSLNRVVAIYAKKTNATAASTYYTGLITDIREIRNAYKSDVTMEIKGEEKVITVPTNIATYGKLVEDTIVQVKVVNKTGEISEVITPVKQNAVVKSTTPGSRIIETTAHGTFYLENDGVIYQDGTFAPLRFADLKKDDVIDLYRIATGSSYVNYVVKGVTPGKDPVATQGEVTFVAGDHSYAIIGSQEIDLIGSAKEFFVNNAIQVGDDIAYELSAGGKMFKITAIADDVTITGVYSPFADLTVDGDLTFTSANTYTASNVTVTGDLTVAATATLNATNFVVEGDTIINGTATFNSELQGDVTVAGTATFKNVEIGGDLDVTAGTATFDGKVTVDGAITGASNITLAAGADAATKKLVNDQKAADTAEGKLSSVTLTAGTNAGTVKLTNGSDVVVEYSVKGGAWTDLVAGANKDNIAVDAGDVIQVRVKDPVSAAKEITVKLSDITRAAAPSGAIASADNDITGLTKDVVYEVKIGEDWVTFTANADGKILAATHAQDYDVADEVEIRVKATDKQPASIVQTITVS